MVLNWSFNKTLVRFLLIIAVLNHRNPERGDVSYVCDMLANNAQLMSSDQIVCAGDIYPGLADKPGIVCTISSVDPV